MLPLSTILLPKLVLNIPLQWRHNGRDSVCLPNRLIRHRSNKTPKLRVTGLCVGNSPHKWPVTRNMFPFDDVIMLAILRNRICLNIKVSNLYVCVRLFIGPGLNQSINQRVLPINGLKWNDLSIIWNYCYMAWINFVGDKISANCQFYHLYHYND